MKIGIISDTHNHLDNTRQALEIFEQHQVDRIIHCGDITTIRVVEMFEGWDATFVFGNMDRGHADLMTTAKRMFGMGSIGYSYLGDWDGIRVAIAHGDDQPRLNELIRSGLYDYVFHGHTHMQRDEKVGRTRVINPGAVGGKRKEKRSVCVLDLQSGEAEFIDLQED